MKLQVDGAHYASSVREAFARLWNDGGVRALFRGNTLAVARILPENAVFASIYEAARERYARNSLRRVPELGSWETFICGILGGAIGHAAIYPLDVRYLLCRHVTK